jgi:hypothetical protein
MQCAMTRFGKIQVTLILVGAAIAGLESLQALHRRAELASVTAQIDAQKQELTSRRKSLEALEERNRELEDAERRAGNQTLLSLMRERNAFTMATSEAAAQAVERSHAFGVSLARTIEAERERASDEAENERRCHEVLGDEGMTFLNGIANEMRNAEAKRLCGIIQDNMGANQLNQDQGDRLQALLKAEVVAINMDDLELFRPPQEWTQDILERQQRILREATAFLTPSQLDTLKNLAAYDLAERQKQMTARRTALGLR